jgi:hypothetical protein
LPIFSCVPPYVLTIRTWQYAKGYKKEKKRHGHWSGSTQVGSLRASAASFLGFTIENDYLPFVSKEFFRQRILEDSWILLYGDMDHWPLSLLGVLSAPSSAVSWALSPDELPSAAAGACAWG